MTLKTLKDIRWKHYNTCDGDYEEGCLSCRDRDIKQEAIKWAKYCGFDETHVFCAFHNITEEDLK